MDLDEKYSSLEDITLIGFNFGDVTDPIEVIEILDALSATFIKDFNYGLGFKREYVCIPNALEIFGLIHLVICKKCQTQISDILCWIEPLRFYNYIKS